ncbi:MAG: erythromycin esterase family protein [Planctomycetota bacterium]
MVNTRTLAALCCAIGSGTTSAQPTPETTAWLQANAHSLAATEPESGLEDLECLRELIGDARVVGLGGSTHGTHEQSQLKHRIVEFLASEMGFSVLAVGASTPDAHRVDRYVSDGKGDAVRFIKGMRSWAFDTEELVEMVQWMRRFNEKDVGPSIRFAGLGAQYPESISTELSNAVHPHDPELANILAAESDALLAGMRSSAPPVLAMTTTTIEAGPLAGKTVRFTADVSTSAIDEYAKIWISAHQADESPALAMTQHAPSSGDSDWRTHELEITIPDGATSLSFGFLMGRTGQAFFDRVTLTADDEPIELPFDPSFETGASSTLIAGIQKPYFAGTSKDRAAHGERSFVISRLNAIPFHKLRESTTAFESRAHGLIDGSNLPAMAAAWAKHMATVLRQSLHQIAPGPNGMPPLQGHERAMADNIHWILDQDPNTKVIVWGHNGDVRALDGSVGEYLKKELGDSYVPVGFSTSAGRYRAQVMGQGHRSNSLKGPHPRTVEAHFDAAEISLAILDTRTAKPVTRGRAG